MPAARGRGRPFQKGQSANPGGRPKGALARVTQEARELARQIFNPQYWELKYQRIHSCTEHPRIEELLLKYAYGEPPKELHASGLVVHLGPLNALTARETHTNALELPALDVQTLSQSLTEEESTDRVLVRADQEHVPR